MVSVASSTAAFVGTSGFSYPHWANGVSYPRDLPRSRWLEYYASKFSTVELNVTFYRLPGAEVFVNWYQRTPRDFKFALKGSRFITHIKKLKSCQQAVKRYFEAAKGLKEKLAVVIWQLPPNFKANHKRLVNFCQLLHNCQLTNKVCQAFEFRHQSWFEESTYQVLKKHHAALCLADSTKWPSREVVTADFVYLRLHGPKGLYHSSYSGEELVKWAKKCQKWLEENKCVYVYFNNDARGYATANAQFLETQININATSSQAST